MTHAKCTGRKLLEESNASVSASPTLSVGSRFAFVCSGMSTLLAKNGWSICNLTTRKMALSHVCTATGDGDQNTIRYEDVAHVVTFLERYPESYGVPQASSSSRSTRCTTNLPPSFSQQTSWVHPLQECMRGCQNTSSGLIQLW